MTLGGLASSPAHAYALMAGLRLAAIGGTHFGDQLTVGISPAARPVIKHRAAGKFQRDAAVPEAGEVWRRFLADERGRWTKLEEALIAVDDGQGAPGARPGAPGLRQRDSPAAPCAAAAAAVDNGLAGPPAGAAGASGLRASAVDRRPAADSGGA